LRRFCRIIWFCSCALFVLTIIVWVRARATRDLLLQANGDGTVIGVATTPGDCFFFRHIDPNRNAQRLQVTLGFSHHSFSIPSPDVSDRYLVPTHSFSGGGGRSAGRGGRRAALVAHPTFTNKWAGPGIRAQVGSFNGINIEQCIISFWLIACALALGPTVSGVRLVARIRRTRYRRHHRQCLLCGFDLRASTDRCPECGHPIPAAAAAKPQAANNTAAATPPPADPST
jgi:hypothetical protein